MGTEARRKREKEERRNQILQSARDLLVKKGIQSVTIQRIAKKSELSIGAIYFYFSNKEEILAALQEEGLEILYRLINEAIERGKSPDKKIIAIAKAYMDFTDDYKDFYDIINYFISTPTIVFPDDLKNRVDLKGNRILVAIENAISEGKKENYFGEIDPRRYAIMIWSMLHSLVQFKKLKGTVFKEDNYDELLNYALERLIKSMKE